MDVQTGEPGLAEVFVANRAQLRRAALAIVRVPEEADDVVQDSYVKLIEARSDAVVRQPLAYCFQVVRNMALDRLRRASFEANLFLVEEEGQAVPSIHGHPERHAISFQNIAIIDRALAALPARTRRAFELYRLNGFTQRDIGRELGVSAGLVNGMIREAMMALTHCRELLGAE
jgi:RNA polymerase sigma factor (sigma-70 family)